MIVVLSVARLEEPRNAWLLRSRMSAGTFAYGPALGVAPSAVGEIDAGTAPDA